MVCPASAESNLLIWDYFRHGACFNVCTGDIEDAPALHAIHSFPTSVSDGKILVTADPKYTLKDDNLVREPKIASLSISAEGPNGVVIVGGGAGASHVVESLREVRSVRYYVKDTHSSRMDTRILSLFFRWRRMLLSIGIYLLQLLTICV